MRQSVDKFALNFGKLTCCTGCTPISLGAFVPSNETNEAYSKNGALPLRIIARGDHRFAVADAVQYFNKITHLVRIGFDKGL